ncbi:MAG: hypothetical protein IH605_14710 [Burkholderiales bacterium]|nr:hypothetical protein [Burkholderiales bacterium]
MATFPVRNASCRQQQTAYESRWHIPLRVALVAAVKRAGRAKAIKFAIDVGSDLISGTATATVPAMLALTLGSAPSFALAQTDECPARPAFAAGDEAAQHAWKRVSDRERICVYSRQSPASSIHEVMAIAAISAAPGRVFEVISDYAHYPAFMPYVTASKVLKKEQGAQWVFQQLAFPFPLSDRYYTIRLDADTSLAPSNVYRVTWRLVKSGEPFQQGKGEPTLANIGFWDLRPLAGEDATQVTYFIHTDPGGALPAFAVNMANSVAVPLVIEKVRARVAASRADATGERH